MEYFGIGMIAFNLIDWKINKNGCRKNFLCDVRLGQEDKFKMSLRILRTVPSSQFLYFNSIKFMKAMAFLDDFVFHTLYGKNHPSRYPSIYSSYLQEDPEILTTRVSRLLTIENYN